MPGNLSGNPPPSYSDAMQHTLNQKLLPLAAKQEQQEKAKLQKNNEDGKFAPVSSIKPMKRGGKGTKPNAQAKRQRHRSAQSAIGRNTNTGTGPAAQLPRQLANKHALLQALLSGTPINITPTQQQTSSPKPSKVTFNLPATTSTYTPASAINNNDPLGSLGSGIPDSPFSPEIQNILDEGLSPNQNLGSSVFRSHSVPVQDMLGGTGNNSNDGFDLLAGNSPLISPNQDQITPSSALITSRQDDSTSMTQAMKSDLTNLLSNKLQEGLSSDNSRGIHFFPGNTDFSAKRNITAILDSKTPLQQQNSELTALLNTKTQLQQNAEAQNLINLKIQPQQQIQQQGSEQNWDLLDSFVGGNDVGGSSFSSQTPKGDVTLTSASLYGGQKRFQFLQNVASTPPTSQNTSPDFNQDLSLLPSVMGLQNQPVHNDQRTTGLFTSTGMNQFPAVTGSSLVDTPNSLDTLSSAGQDSRESLSGDPFFQVLQESGMEMPEDLSTGGPCMDISETSDFSFPQLDVTMPQMVP